jgi:hypothetical protein
MAGDGPDDDPGDDDDAVGYGRPPKATRWKKGQSGNPAGKRKRDEALIEKLMRITGEEVPVTQNGTQTVMPAVEAMLRALTHKAMKGDIPALKLTLEHLLKGVESSSPVPEFPITETDLSVLKTQADWLGLFDQARAEVKEAADPHDPEDEDDARF